MAGKGFFQYGALGLSFTVCRVLQLICLISSLGMASRFISEMVDDYLLPPRPLIAVLCISIFGLLYNLTTALLYHDGFLPFVATAICDFFFFIALVTASTIVGQPLSYLSCKNRTMHATVQSLNSVPDASGPGATAGTSTYRVHSRTFKMVRVEYPVWVAGEERTCVMMKAIWGFGMSLTVLYFFSACAAAFLYKRRRAEKQEGKAESIASDP